MQLARRIREEFRGSARHCIFLTTAFKTFAIYIINTARGERADKLDSTRILDKVKVKDILAKDEKELF